MKLNSSLLVIPADVRLRHEELGSRHRPPSPHQRRSNTAVPLPRGAGVPASSVQPLWRREQPVDAQQKSGRVPRHSLTEYQKRKTSPNYISENPVDPGGLQSSSWSVRPSYGASYGGAAQMSEALESLCFLRGLDELEHFKDMLRIKHEGRLRVLAAGLGSGNVGTGNKLRSPRPSTPPNPRRASPSPERYSLVPSSTSSSSSGRGSSALSAHGQDLIEVVDEWHHESPPGQGSPERRSAESVRLAPESMRTLNRERRYGERAFGSRGLGGSDLPIMITPTTQTDTPRLGSPWLEEISTSYLTKRGGLALDGSFSLSKTSDRPNGDSNRMTNSLMALNDTTNALAGSFSASRMTDFHYSVDSQGKESDDGGGGDEFLSVLEKRTGHLAQSIEQFATRL